MEEDLRVPEANPPASALYAVRYSYHWEHAWKYVVVRPPIKAVGLMVATFGNKRGTKIHPGVKRLIAATGYTKPIVIEALATMRWLGFMWRASSAQGSNSGHSDEYQLCLPRSMDHVPRVDTKTLALPVYSKMSATGQCTACILRVAERLGVPKDEWSTEMTRWSTELTTLVNPVDHWWLSQLTPPTHLTNTSTYSSDHHSDSAESGPRASSRARHYDFDDEDDCYDYVMDAFGDDLDPYEMSTMEGLLSKGEHPKMIVNKINRMRREAA